MQSFIKINEIDQQDNLPNDMRFKYTGISSVLGITEWEQQEAQMKKSKISENKLEREEELVQAPMMQLEKEDLEKVNNSLKEIYIDYLGKISSNGKNQTLEQQLIEFYSLSSPSKFINSEFTQNNSKILKNADSIENQLENLGYQYLGNWGSGGNGNVHQLMKIENQKEIKTFLIVKEFKVQAQDLKENEKTQEINNYQLIKDLCGEDYFEDIKNQQDPEYIDIYNFFNPCIVISAGDITLQDLFKFQKRENIDWNFSQLVVLFIQLMKIIQTICNLGIYHCDIKEHNISLTKDGQLHLFDYGTIIFENIKKYGSHGKTKLYSLKDNVSLEKTKLLEYQTNKQERLGFIFEMFSIITIFQRYQIKEFKKVSCQINHNFFKELRQQLLKSSNCIEQIDQILESNLLLLQQNLHFLEKITLNSIYMRNKSIILINNDQQFTFSQFTNLDIENYSITVSEDQLFIKMRSLVNRFNFYRKGPAQIGIFVEWLNIKYFISVNMRLITQKDQIFENFMKIYGDIEFNLLNLSLLILINSSQDEIFIVQILFSFFEDVIFNSFQNKRLMSSIQAQINQTLKQILDTFDQKPQNPNTKFIQKFFKIRQLIWNYFNNPYLQNEIANPKLIKQLPDFCYLNWVFLGIVRGILSSETQLISDQQFFAQKLSLKNEINLKFGIILINLNLKMGIPNQRDYLCAVYIFKQLWIQQDSYRIIQFLIQNIEINTRQCYNIFNQYLIHLQEDKDSKKSIISLVMLQMGIILKEIEDFTQSQQILQQARCYQLENLAPYQQIFLRTLNEMIAVYRKLNIKEKLQVCLKEQERFRNYNQVNLNSISPYLRQQAIGFSKIEEREKFYRQNYQFSKQIFLPEDPAIIISINNLASTIFKSDNFEEAEMLYRQALDLNLKNLQSNDIRIAKSMDRLAEALYNTEKFQECELMLTESLDRQRKLLQNEDPQIKYSLENLLDLYCYIQEWEQAFRIIDELEQIILKMNPLEQLSARQFFFKKAEVMLNLNNPQEFQNVFDFLLQIIHKIQQFTDTQFDDIISTLSQMAQFHNQQQNYQIKRVLFFYGQLFQYVNQHKKNTLNSIFYYKKALQIWEQFELLQIYQLEEISPSDPSVLIIEINLKLEKILEQIHISFIKAQQLDYEGYGQFRQQEYYYQGYWKDGYQQGQGQANLYLLLSKQTIKFFYQYTSIIQEFRQEQKNTNNSIACQLEGNWIQNMFLGHGKLQVENEFEYEVNYYQDIIS